MEQGVARTLELTRTWLAWDGQPRRSEDGDRLYTPNKVIRRYADYLIDHLAEIEALLAGAETEPDHWHGSLVTFASLRVTARSGRPSGVGEAEGTALDPA